MHILLGLILAVALLYFWLIGHWFARILAFLVFAGALFVVGILVLDGMHAKGLAAAVFDIAASLALGWLVSSLPTWYWRERMRAIARLTPAAARAGSG